MALLLLTLFFLDHDSEGRQIDKVGGIALTSIHARGVQVKANVQPIAVYIDAAIK